MKTVAVIDDDDDLRMLMVMRLRAAGYEVRQSGDGVAGLELIRACRPDLVIVDWMMPGKTGIEVCRDLQVDPDLAATPILIVTARASARDRELGIAAGATSLMTKPFSLAAFVEVIDDLLEPDSGAA